MPCTADLERRDYLDFLPKRPQGTTKILGTSALAGTRTPAAPKVCSKGATTACVAPRQLPALRAEVIGQSVGSDANRLSCFLFCPRKRLEKAQETQSYQRIQHTGHTDFNTSGTNAATFVSRDCGGYTFAFANRIAHKRLHAETGSVSDGVLLLPSDCFTRFGNPAWPGIRTAYFAAFGSWPGVLPKNAESLRDSDALMRVAVPQASRPRWAAQTDTAR